MDSRKGLQTSSKGGVAVLEDLFCIFMNFSSIHNFFVETFTGLVKLGLTFLALAILIGGLFGFLTQGLASILSGEYVEGAGYLLMIPVSFYTAVGIQKTLGKSPS